MRSTVAARTPLSAMIASVAACTCARVWAIRGSIWASSGGGWSATRDRGVAVGPPDLEMTPGEPPPAGGAHQPVGVTAGDDVQVAARRPGPDVLCLQVALRGRGVAVDLDGHVADEVLAAVERAQRGLAHLLDGLVPLGPAETLVHGHRVVGEAGPEQRPVAGVQGGAVPEAQPGDVALVQQQ